MTAAAPPLPDSRPLAALAWMLGATASFVTMAVAGREIAVELNTFELMLYRSIIGFAIVCALIARSRRGFAQVRTRVFPEHIKRNVFHFTGQNLWFYGVAAIPMAQLVALEFTNPIWVAILAPFFLGERLTGIKIAAALLGFLGVLIVAQPGYAPIEAGHIAGLGAAMGFALNTLFTKRIMKHDTVLCVLFWMTLLQGVMALFLSLPGGIPVPSSHMVHWIVLIGICGLTAHYCLTSALGNAPATIVAPMEFIRLPVISVTAMLIYGEPLLLTVFLGAAVIFAGNFINIVAGRRPSRSAA